MAPKHDKTNGSVGLPKESLQAAQAQSDATNIGRVITADDAGWVSATGFVTPLTFVPIDPPRPLNRRRPANE